MNIKEIKEMIQLMNENALSELELEKEGLKIRLKKGPSGAIEQTVISEGAGDRAAAGRSEAPNGSRTPVAAPTRALIKSPMVGTFYVSPAPDAPPFVTPGAAIEVGQVVCVIEAMKLMNEIKSELRGKVAEVLVKNGDPVEFGQPLFALE